MSNPRQDPTPKIRAGDALFPVPGRWIGWPLWLPPVLGLALAGTLVLMLELSGFAANAIVLLALFCFSTAGMFDGLGAIASRLYIGRLRHLGQSLPPPAEWPPVAILLPCCDDFQVEATKTLVSQDYPDFHLFILDDSTVEANSASVEEFCKENSERVSRFRREDRSHAKAGNLNAGLAILPARYRFLCFCDSDERMPAGSLRELIPWLTSHPEIAFVQALHCANPPREAGFAATLGFMVRAFWQSAMPSRMYFGMPAMLGHGCVVRREALDEVGGFPKSTSEDIRLTGQLRRNGWRGAIAAPSKLLGEDMPETLAQLRRRMLRWAKQDTGSAAVETVLMAKAPDVSPSEKLDWFYRNLKFPLRGLVPLWWLALSLAALFSGGRFFGEGASLTFSLCLLCSMLVIPLLVYILDCERRSPGLLIRRLSGVLTISLFTVSAYSRALLSWVVAPSVEFVPTAHSKVIASRESRIDSFSELLLNLVLVGTSLLAHQAVLSVLGIAAIAGASLSTGVTRGFGFLRCAMPLLLALALAWDVTHGESGMFAILAIAAIAALLG